MSRADLWYRRPVRGFQTKIWLVLPAAALAACTAAPSLPPTASAEPRPPPAAAVATSFPEQQLAPLITAAQVEGELNVIALPHDWCGNGEIISAFRVKYGIRVNEGNPDADSAAQIAALKVNPGKTSPAAPDVVDLAVDALTSFDIEGLLQPYQVLTWDGIPEAAKNPNGYWYGNYYGVLSFLVNTDVQPNLPHDWVDLLRPEYRAQVALSGDPRTSDQGAQTVLAAALANGGSSDDAMPGLAFFGELRRAGNLLPMVSNNALVGSGDTPVRITWDYNALAGIQSFAGKPRAAVVIPTTGRLANLYVQAINAHAPHPNAARLWMEYLFSDEGQIRRAHGLCHPIRQRHFLARGGALAEVVAQLPDVTGAAFPTAAQLAEAKRLVAERWMAIVRAGIEGPE